jgi:ABC-type cobalamin/Fe3+-siderophores transport system ATPase subunit
VIQTLSIQNFRSHKKVLFNDCGRVNLLLGRNNSGKTAVLEAILLLCFPPNPREVLILLNDQRGYKPGDENYELWNSYFNRWEPSQPISLSVEDIPAHSGRIVCQNLSITAEMGFANPVTSGSVIEGRDVLDKTQGLVFKYRYESGNVEKKISTLKRKTRQALPSKVNGIVDQIRPIAFIPAKGIANPQDEAERFSRLEKANRHHEVEEALRAVEPRLKRLTVIAGGQGSMVYGDLGEAHLTPVALMGEGMVRMLSIATALVNNQGGLVLIDEIENGLHYSVLPSLWKMIFKTAQALDIQVFATTHSDECILAASQMAQTEYENDLRLFRLDLVQDKTIVTDYSGQELAVAIASDQEVR